jgi:hypothetical protein
MKDDSSEYKIMPLFERLQGGMISYHGHAFVYLKCVIRIENLITFQVNYSD